MSALPTAIEVVRDPGHARTLLEPERLRLMEELGEAPASAAELARRLGESRQRLNYHLRLLEEAGVVEVVETRRKGTERVYRPVARRLVVATGAVGGAGDMDPAEAGDRFSGSYLVALAARAIREVAELLDKAKRRGERLATASVNARVRLATPSSFDAFARDLNEAVAEVVAKHHDGSDRGMWFRVVAGAYPGTPGTLENGGER